MHNNGTSGYPELCVVLLRAANWNDNPATGFELLQQGRRDFFRGVPMAMEDDDILCVHAEGEDPERYDYICDVDEARAPFQ